MSNENRVYGGNVISSNEKSVKVRFDRPYDVRFEGDVYSVSVVDLAPDQVRPYLNGGSAIKLPYSAVVSGMLREVKRQRGSNAIDSLMGEWDQEDDRMHDEVDMP